MCDYSLIGVPNRLATKGEELVVYMFPTRTKGLASRADVAASNQKVGFWQKLKDLFRTPKLDPLVPAVCIPPGAQLALRDIPDSLQHAFKVDTIENVTFTQISATAHAHRDAVRFNNGTEILLQKLFEGQSVKVLSLDLAPEKEPLRPHGAASRFGDPAAPVDVRF